MGCFILWLLDLKYVRANIILYVLITTQAVAFSPFVFFLMTLLAGYRLENDLPNNSLLFIIKEKVTKKGCSYHIKVQCTLHVLFVIMLPVTT